MDDALAALTPAQRELLMRAGVRRRSANEFLGLPWYHVALGPDPARGQSRGHAKGVIAVGGAAVGHYAIGGAPSGTYVAGPERVDRAVFDLFASAGLEVPMPPVRPPARAR